MVEPQLVELPVLLLTEVEGVAPPEPGVRLAVLIHVRGLNEDTLAAATRQQNHLLTQIFQLLF